jgi:3-oxoadipate enol-lactonase
MTRSSTATAKAAGQVWTVKYSQGSLTTRTWGAGEPVVLLHPLALSGEVWQPLGAALSTQFQVFAPDLRGHGRSSWDRDSFTIKDMARDVAEAMDSLSLPSAHLLGMSMGGSVALTLAGLFPERVKSLVLADTTAWYGPNAPNTWAERAEKAVSVPRDRQLAFQVDRWFSEQFRAARPDEVDRISRIFVATDSAAHAAASNAMGELDSRRLLRSITARTLVMVGEQDYATPPAMAEQLAGSIPDASLLVLPALRHLSLVERPELAATVRDHLQGKRVAAK